MLKRILDETRQALRQDVGRLLGELRVALVRLHASEESQKALVRSIAQLDELFMLVVVGEFNTGKSAVINALLGERVLQEGVTPTTSQIGQLRYGTAASRASTGGGGEVITLPLEILREITIVDTPGTNAVLRDHEALTREFVPRSDLVLFVTSADRPFTESERAFLEAIQSWGKKVTLALNKVDILERPEDVATVVDFVKEQALTLLGLRPRVFAVSARDARRAKTDGDDALLSASGFAELESFVTNTLNEAVRLRLKLLNPLGVGLRVGGEAEALAEERLAFLKDDSTLLEAVDAQLVRDREELGREMRMRFADVERVLVEHEQRAADSLDRNLSLRRLFDRLDRDGTRALFEHEVAGEPSSALEKRVDEIVSWLVTREAELWHAVAERVRLRQSAHNERAPGELVGMPQPDGARPLVDVRREVQRALEGSAPRAEATRLANGARTAAIGTLLLQPLAAGIAAASIALAATGWARAGGLLLAVALSLAGILLLPALRRKAGTELRERNRRLHEALVNRLKASLDRELDESRRRALDALHPYREFVRSEAGRFRAQRDQLRTLRGGLETLRDRIQSL
ncbi:MAG TPA: dynamin family protein [Vicinamibacteria bacterium]|nr:dynamin family protein [Vicinamibacteria bacterium]